MRTRSFWRTLLPLWLSVGATCLAPAARAVVLPFTGTITVELDNVLSASFRGAGFATIDGSGSGGHVSALALGSGAIATQGLTISITSPSVAPIRGLQVTARNGDGSFAETAMGALRGVMPILGVSKICLFGACNAAVANVSVPLSVIGVGGRGVATGPVNVTVEGAPWTKGTAVNALPFTPYLTTRMGFAHGPASQDGSTAGPSGSIQLVTPIVVWTNLGIDQPSVFGFVTATLHFVPEPAPLALLAGGCLLLGVRARRSREAR